MAVTGDHGQEIIEVMRNAPGEPSDGFHLVRLQQVRLLGRLGPGASSYRTVLNGPERF